MKRRDAASGEPLYSQADLDFFSANADEYFEMANALRRERHELREALKWAYGNAARLADSGVSLKERVRRLNHFRDEIDAVLYPKKEAESDAS